MTEQELNKACDAYCQVCGHYPHKVPTHICRQDCDYYMEFRKAMGAVVKESLTTALTWQDVRKIVEIADAMIDEDIAGELPEHLATPKAYYTETLKRFKESKED